MKILPLDTTGPTKEFSDELDHLLLRVLTLQRQRELDTRLRELSLTVLVALQRALDADDLTAATEYLQQERQDFQVSSRDDSSAG